MTMIKMRVTHPVNFRGVFADKGAVITVTPDEAKSLGNKAARLHEVEIPERAERPARVSFKKQDKEE